MTAAGADAGHSPFRSRLSVYVGRVPALLGGAPHYVQHECGGQLCRPCGGRKFLWGAQRERVNRRRYQTRAEVRADVFDYIERWHNPRPRQRRASVGVEPVRPGSVVRSSAGRIHPNRENKNRSRIKTWGVRFLGRGPRRPSQDAMHVPSRLCLPFDTSRQPRVHGTVSAS